MSACVCCYEKLTLFTPGPLPRGRGGMQGRMGPAGMPGSQGGRVPAPSFPLRATAPGRTTDGEASKPSSAPVARLRKNFAETWFWTDLNTK